MDDPTPSRPKKAPGERLRRLVACPACGRQYDAAGHDPGSRFHCACGALMEASDARPHDAAVVRCSSCGGPRQQGAAACGFCSADFTVHERDLHTMCPGCMSRIGDRARYCHGCGLAIAPQGTVGRITERRCPACGDEHELYARDLEHSGEQVHVLECDRCAGIWVGHRIFELLEKRARQDIISSWSEPAAAQPSPRQDPAGGATFYRKCIECGALMNRKNYGAKSGVIVDICAQHGIWLDGGELEDILAWVRAGGPQRAAALEREQRRTPVPPILTAPLGETREWPRNDRGDFVGRVVWALIDYFTRR